MEFMTVAAARYDLDRFGAALPRFSPRQADLLLVVGTVNCKQAPILRRVYEQIAEPKWVVAFGVCASSGGFYDNYATVQGIDRIVPVDVYIPGCPPRPEQVLDGIMLLQKKIQDQQHKLIDRKPLPVVGQARSRWRGNMSKAVIDALVGRFPMPCTTLTWASVATTARSRRRTASRTCAAF